MRCFRSSPSSSLVFSLFLFAYSTSVLADLRAFHYISDSDEGEGSLVAQPWGRGGRNLVETDGGLTFPLHEKDADNSTMKLAAERTRRKDPLRKFEQYNGGWNISDKHYWASVGFTAAPLFVIAIVWLVLFGLCLIIICLFFCCCRKTPYGYSRIAYALSLIFLVLFTLAAIVGCVVLYTGQGRFDSHSKKTLNYVVNEANEVVVSLHNVSRSLASAKQVTVSSSILPAGIEENIDAIDAKINSSIFTLTEKVGDNSKKIKKTLNTVIIALIILAAIMLGLTFLGFLFSILGMECLVYILVVLGWILVSGTFILCGVFIILHNVAGDTCVAMDEWDRNPMAYTALDDILPCVDKATAKEALMQSKNVTFQLVGVVNLVVYSVANVDAPPGSGGVYYNQSGPLMPTLCNPYDENLVDRLCGVGEVPLRNATEVWKKFVCEVSTIGICSTPGRITPTYYNQMVVAVTISNALSYDGPFLIDLADCSFVRRTFSDINSNYCPGLKLYTKWIYIGLAMVSSAVMLSLIFWVLYARERRHRVYTKGVNVVSHPGWYTFR